MVTKRRKQAAPKGAPLTIGQLAKRAGVSTSMLRFYEREGLLAPPARSASGYRLYPGSAVRALTFIHRAQRLGFSLGDIRLLLANEDRKAARGHTVVGIAEQRFIEIERRLTELLVLRHELELFLDDLTGQVGRAAGGNTARIYRQLVDHVCGHEAQRPAPGTVQRLIKRLGCALATVEQDRVFGALRGRHMHVWKETDGYTILVRDRGAAVLAALERLVAAEAGCNLHVDVILTPTPDGLQLRVRGDNAFLYAQLFLTLEATA
ncbi:MAG TPA: MerR family DNA-binding transcriptional regulator [Steroidobacteraceae bacterium]|nr:MerR family DNA-binding transcriptional regulator [Steroidobacteraceae bacterium]